MTRLDTRKCVKFGRFSCRSTISIPGFMQKAPSPMNAHTRSSGCASAKPEANMVDRLIDASR